MVEPSTIPESPDDTSCDALLARVALGDRAALAETYRLTRAVAWAACVRLLRDRALAEDALAEGYLRVWRQAAGWRPDLGRGADWVLAIVRAACLDRLARAPAAMRPVADAPDPLARDAPARRFCPEETAPGPLAALDASQRKALLEAYVYGRARPGSGPAFRAMRGLVRTAVERLREPGSDAQPVAPRRREAVR